MKKVRAIILQDHEIILIKREKLEEIYWVFPGGGVEKTDSSLEEALKRECLEELGADVYVNNLFFKQKFQDNMEYFYICNIKSGKLGTGNGPEYQDNNFYIGSHKIEKYKISEIKNLNVKPNNIRDSIVDFYKMF